MSIRKIDTALSTIRSVFDEDGNYIPSGNFFFSTKEVKDGNFIGKLTNKDGLNFGKFTLSPRKLVKMMAVAQSGLANKANLSNQEGMPSYSFPSSDGSGLSHFIPRNIVSNYTPRSFIREPETCSICLENLTSYNKKSLTCKHNFHMTCINIWLRDKNTCPLCRASQVSVPQPRDDTFMTTVSELSRNANRNTLYTRLRSRDYSEGGNRTVVFPSSRRK